MESCAPPVIGIVAHRVRSKAEFELDGQIADYSRSVGLAGGAPVLIPLNLDENGWRRIYERLDGLLFPGGGDIDPSFYNEKPHPQLGRVDAALDEAEFTLAHWALADQMPVLGICRGIQLLNVAAGGSLYQDLPAQFPGVLPHRSAEMYAHTVQIEPRAQLAAILDETECRTNSRHHQAVKDVAPGFIATAHTSDGVIEGIEMTDVPFCIGVQWHPENLVPADPIMLRLFQAFVRAACAYGQD